MDYKKNLFRSAPPLGFSKARANRNDMTEAEQILWEKLKSRQVKGFKFRRQHPLGIYIADFYCHEKKLVIEADGRYHKHDDIIKYDRIRTFTFNLDKIKVIRFSNSDITNRIEWVMEEINKELEKS